MQVAATIALVVVVASLWWAQTTREAAVPANAEQIAAAPTPVGDAAELQPATINTADARPVAATVFPPRGTPIAEMLRLLQPAADAGNVRAQCRLAAELSFCKFAEFHMQALLAGEARERLTGEAEPNSEPATDYDAAMLDLHTQCRALPPGTMARGDAWLGAAARAGDPESMYHYIEGQHLVGRSSHDFMAHPDFERWRRDAPSMLQRMLRAGEPEAAFLLSIAAGGDFALAGAVIPDDPVQALAGKLLMRRINGSTHTAPPITGRDPDVVRRAEALAARWHHEYYDDRVLVDRSLLRIYWIPPALQNPTRWREPCTD
jgi:hypothetical protein